MLLVYELWMSLFECCLNYCNNFLLFSKALYDKSLEDDKIKSIFTEENMVNILTSTTNDDNTQEIFNVFLDYFGESIAEYSNFKKELKRNVSFRDACTPSDEAFGIFTIERCWSNWMSEFRDNERNAIRTAQYTKKNSNRKHGGWTIMGLQRFSEIARDVSSARSLSVRKNMEESYRKKYEDKYSENENMCSRPKPDFQNEVIFEPYNDLPKEAGAENNNDDEDDNDDSEIGVDEEDNNNNRINNAMMESSDLTENTSVSSSSDDDTDHETADDGFNNAQSEVHLHAPMAFINTTGHDDMEKNSPDEEQVEIMNDGSIYYGRIENAASI